jgi:hypothetical protein
MPRNEGSDVQRNENEHRTSEGADIGQRSDELNVHNVPGHHFARHRKGAAVVDRCTRATWLDVVYNWSKISIVTFMAKVGKGVTYVH